MEFELDFADVPDSVPPIETGQYNLTVKKHTWRDAEGKKKASHAVELFVAEGPMEKRVVFDDFPPEFLAQNSHPVTVRFKHFLQSCGVTLRKAPIKELLDEAVGKTCVALVQQRNYTDTKTNETKSATGVKDYLVIKS